MVALSGTMKSAVREHCLEDAGHKAWGWFAVSRAIPSEQPRSVYSPNIGLYEAITPGLEVSLQMKRVWRGDCFSVR